MTSRPIEGETRWHQMPAGEVVEALGSSPWGLAAAVARRRLAEHGPNVLVDGQRRSALGIVAGQFTDFMILVLIAAALISGLIGAAKDALAILAIVILNAALGFVQEYRAERALTALRAMAAPTATVVRDGVPMQIPSAEIVVGDLVWLETGGVVPADLRLVDSAHLRVDEALLTGESVPVDKTTAPLPGERLPPGDRTNLAFKGTTVTHGRGTGVAVATGMATEFGRIAALLEGTVEVKTPLQQRLAEVGRRLAVAALLICAAVFGGGILRGEPPLLMFMTAVSLAVAAIPEALPVVVTITLALGARKMVQQRALVRRLPSVETLGSVTYICSDKTGTLTLNRMRVEELACDGAVAPAARAVAAGAPWDELLRAMALSNDASVTEAGAILGDPTEAALLLAARDAGLDKSALEAAWPRVAEIPFDAARKCMTTIHRHPAGGFVSFTKGAVEVLLDRAAALSTSTGPREIRPHEVLSVSERMATDGLRVLAVAMRTWPALPESVDAGTVERDLTLLGLAGLMDPPRPEAREAVETCRSAGIVAVMITGDHPLTARAVARRLGILGADDGVMTGQELATLSTGDLERRARDVRVYARVAPEQKLRIVRALQARGETVAMTGDGVNDAPALKQADIGVAMGITGTDVSKQASAMILLDDNFATVVRAVREGRKIYDNLRKFIRFAVTTNSSEVLIVLLGPFLGLPMPLLPIQILWINLVTDGLPSLALASEPAARDVMRRPPRRPDESVFAHGLGRHVVWVALLMAALALGAQAWFLAVGSPRWQTVVFTVIALSQLAHVLAIRSERESLFTQGFLSNAPLAGAVVLTLLLQMAVVYVPFLNDVFHTQPLTGTELATAVLVSTLVFVAVEAEKWLGRARSAHRP